MALLSSVLRSKRAVQVNVAITRAFVQLPQLLSGHKELAINLPQYRSGVPCASGTAPVALWGHSGGGLMWIAELFDTKPLA